MSVLHLRNLCKYIRMKAKKKNESLKSLEQLLEETQAKKKILLKILKKITKENSKDQTPK